MRLVSKALQQAVRKCLNDYRTNTHPLPGIAQSSTFEPFVSQLFDSIRRVEYLFVLQNRDISPERADPKSAAFDPIMGAILHSRLGHLDEACWLAFLTVHFGKNARTGWSLLRDVYGARGGNGGWDWSAIQANPQGFVTWLSRNHHNLSGLFGNHRKYLSLKPTARAGTDKALVGYASWVTSYGSHADLLRAFTRKVGTDRGQLFDALYKSMGGVKSFGRTGRFDYLTMLGKLSLFPVEPGSPYLPGSTGPKKGADLLFNGSARSQGAPKVLDQQASSLGVQLAGVGVRFAMQVLEDALCNWQKSPTTYERFRG